MDDADFVARQQGMHEAQFLQMKLREQRKLRPSATTCIECDSPIPKARQMAIQGVQLCIVCQSAKE
ncbi:MAG: TraR/DksA C4-type zinc finger protein [Parashewanella sp.]